MGEFTIKDSLVSFESPAVTDVTSAKVYFEPVQEGEGDPSPENVRNITGWTGAELHRCGKNIFSGKQIVELLYGSNYTVYEDEYGKYIYIGSTSIINVPNNIFKENTRYTFIMKIYDESINNTLCFQIHYTDGSATNISAPRDALKVAVTTSANKTVQGIHGLLRTAKRRFYFEESGVFEGVVPIAAYEPYKGPILPSEYQEVEYLESAEGAYTSVSVGIQSTDIFRAEIKFQYLGEATNNFWLAGDGLSKNSYQFEFGRWGGWYHSYDTAIYTSVSGAFPNEIIEASQERTYSENVTLNFRVCQRAGFTAETSNRRIYYVRLLINSNLISNLIPCYRKSDNEPGMYDTVSGTFFTNQGTGEFIIGSNVYYDTIPVSWETEAGTVYGGYVDLVSGELVSEYQILTLGESISPLINGRSSSGGYANSTLTGADGCKLIYFEIGWPTASFIQYSCKIALRDNAVMNMRTLRTDINAWTSTAASTVNFGDFVIIQDSNYKDYEGTPLCYCYVSVPSSCTDLASKRAYLAEHPITLCYPLKHSVTYQLTQQQLQTLKGQNNFWGNTNADTEITYEVADALKMTQIRKNILMSQPHIESATAANPLTFQTDISASIKGGKVYFEPVQEGSGDPSPDNVRPISGWDGVEISISGRNLIHSGIEWLPTKIKPSNGKIAGSVYNSFYFPVPKGTLHLYKRTTSISYMALVDKIPEIGDAVYNSRGITNYNGFDVTMDNSAGHKYMVLFGPTGTVSKAVYDFCVSNTAYVGIETWSPSQPYPPDVPASSITIPFPQTIYGGYVDLVKWEVVEEWVGFTFDGVNYKAKSDYTDSGDKQYIKAYWVYWSPRATNPSKSVSVMCDKLPITRNHNTGYFSSAPCLYAAGNGQLFGGLVLGTKEDYPDLAEATSADRINAVNAWFAENPTTVVYSKSERDTKTTYQLTPETIKALKGVNNIWSNANGNIEIKFWKH